MFVGGPTSSTPAVLYTLPVTDLSIQDKDGSGA